MAIAAGVVYLLSRIPSSLHVHTDIVGYPIFADFNPAQYLNTFYLVVLGGPVITIAAFAGLRALTSAFVPISQPSRRPLLPASRLAAGAAVSETASLSLPNPFVAAGSGLRVLVPGAVLGVEIAMDRGVTRHAWAYVAVAAILYVVVTAAAAAALKGASSRRVRVRALCPTFADALSAVNALGTCVTVLGLWAVARGTIVVSSGGTVHHYEWLPLPVALALTSAIAVGIAAALVRGNDRPGRAHTVERRCLILVALPVAGLLSFGQLLPAGRSFDVFENGLQASSVRFLQQGLVPWRDFIVDHGLLEDTFKPLVGATAIQNTAWGMYSGVSLLITPLTLMGWTYIAYRATSGYALPLLAAVSYSLFAPWASTVDRFIPWAFVLILTWVVIQRRSTRGGVALGVATVVFAVVTPEAAYCALATGVGLLASDLYYGELSRGRLIDGLKVTLCWLAGCAVAGAVLLGVFVASGSLSAFVTYYVGALAGHDLTGGIPALTIVGPYLVAAMLPAAGVLAAVAILAVKLRRRVVLRAKDFALLASAVLAVLYYQKFTGRADVSHLAQSLGMSIPLLILLADQAFRLAERIRSAGLRARRFHVMAAIPLVPALAIGGAIFGGHNTLPTSLTSVASHVREVTGLPPGADLGWYAAEPMQHQLGTFLAAYMRPGDSLYDFTNEPGLFYFLLHYRPASNYFIVGGSAFKQDVQRQIVSDLEKTRPRIVAFYGDAFGGLPTWDGISNPIRHYDISQWILDHYHPLAAVGDFVFYARGSVSEPDDNSLYFRGFNCNWGLAPEFLSIPHPPESAAVTPAVSASDGSLTITPPSGHAWGEFHWLEIAVGASRMAGDRFTLLDATGPGQRAVTFQSLAGADPVYRFPVGACPQWHGYGSSPLLLTHAVTGQQIAAVRLLP